ncbi:MazG-like family protein [Rodentibacter caecimuris]|uniref:MazG-like family protein n=1 Tax=Rodentibacter caecimuris TaxID=1796644 RepID=UPI00258EE7EE|nr:MazG-like family protein [Rodentibacter heylii]
MTDLQQLIKNIELWAEDRNLIEGSTPQKQFIKLMEEFGELCSGVSKNKVDVVKDSIGDCFVVLTILNAQYRVESTKPNSHQSHLLEPTGHFGAHTLDEAILRAAAKIGQMANPSTRNGDWDVNALVNYLFLIAKMADLDFKECIQHAYDQIKNRKGKMIDGVFVKEGDLRRVGRSKLLGASYGNK